MPAAVGCSAGVIAQHPAVKLEQGCIQDPALVLAAVLQKSQMNACSPGQSLRFQLLQTGVQLGLCHSMLQHSETLKRPWPQCGSLRHTAVIGFCLVRDTLLTATAPGSALHCLQVYPNSNAIVVSTENITQNWYFGNERSMLIPNCLFRVGGACMLLSNK